MYSLQIALSDSKLAKEIAKYSTEENLFKNTKVSINGDSTLSTFMYYRPDILFIDSKMASSEGYKIINLLSYLSFNKKFFKIYVFSNSPKDFTNTEVVTSLKMPVSLTAFKSTIKKIYKGLNNSPNIIQLSKPHNQQDWKNILYELGFSITNLGTNYLSYILDNYKACDTSTNLIIIYEAVAQKYNVTSIQVKSSINSSIRNMRKNISSSKIYSILPCYDGREITTKYLLLSLIEMYG